MTDGSKRFGQDSLYRRVDAAGEASFRREDVAQAPRRWRWLEEFRLRFELAIEILGVDLDPLLNPLSGLPHSAALRNALQALGRTELSGVVAGVVRSRKQQSVNAGGLRIRFFPLFMRSASPASPAGVLVIADVPSSPSRGSTEESAAVSDRRLDAAGQWLVAAIEASLGAALKQVDDARGAELVTGSFDVIEAMTQLQTDHEMIALLMDALALWYDADVYAYRQDLSGAFVLHACLPGADAERVAPQLPGHQIWGRSGAFSPESAREIDELGWSAAMGHTLFVPIAVDQSTEWLLAVIEAGDDPLIKETLEVLGRVAGALLTDLQRQSVERLGRKLASILLFGEAPFHATARMALEAAAKDLSASSAQFTTFDERRSEPLFSIQWGGAETDVAPYVDAGTSSLSPGAIAVGVGAGSGFTAVLSIKRHAGVFAPGAQRLARSAASTIGIWLSGSLMGSLDIRTPETRDYGSNLVQRLRARVDQFGHVKMGGAVAVMLSQHSPAAGPALDDAVGLIEDHVRPTDVIGVVGANGAGVLLPEATRDVASAVVGRLLRAAQDKGLVPVRIGVAMFAASSESPESVLERALMNARRGSAP